MNPKEIFNLEGNNKWGTPIQMHGQNELKRKRYKSKKLNNDVIVQL